MDSSINSSDVQWYKLKDTGTTERVEQHGSDVNAVPTLNNNSFTTVLTITNANRSHTGYYWVRLPSNDVCNVSLTVTTSMWITFSIHSGSYIAS